MIVTFAQFSARYIEVYEADGEFYRENKVFRPVLAKGV